MVLLADYPAQLQETELGRALIYPFCLPSDCLVGRFVRYDSVGDVDHPSVVVVRVGERSHLYLVNTSDRLEFSFRQNAHECPSTDLEIAELHFILPAQDTRILNRVADVRLPGADGLVVHGRYVRVDSNSGVYLILTDEPEPRIFTNWEVMNGLCTGNGCTVTSG